jgi:hypothetical protein
MPPGHGDLTSADPDRARSMDAMATDRQRCVSTNARIYDLAAPRYSMAFRGRHFRGPRMTADALLIVIQRLFKNHFPSPEK